jgi:hypothetical protein
MSQRDLSSPRETPLGYPSPVRPQSYPLSRNFPEKQRVDHDVIRRPTPVSFLNEVDVMRDTPRD